MNLARADLRKDGTSFDLPIAIGLLAACNEATRDALAGLHFAGELALSGEIKTSALAHVIDARCSGGGQEGIYRRRPTERQSTVHCERVADEWPIAPPE